jgi:hypothetical protein
MLRNLGRTLAGLTAALLVLGLAPGSAAAATVPATPPAFGVQFHGMWSSYDDAQRAVILDQLAASGATWVRIDVSWAMLQPTGRDSYDLAWGVPFVDRVLRMATARGLKPLVTLWLTPGWANGGAGERTLPTDAQDYARAAGWAAHRWADVVPAWEIWNEPNDDYFLRGADPVAYTRLLQAAYPRIKAGSPSAQVVLGGPNQNDTTWLGKVYAAGAKGAFDVLATHPYMAVADQAPELPDDGTRYRFTHLASVHALMAAHGDGDKEIWATEFGWSSHANTGGEANWERGVTPTQQGDFLVRALQLAATTMPYVTHLFWYTDRDYTAGNVQNSNYGLLDRDLKPKPAYAAVRAYLLGTADVAAVPDTAAVRAVPTTTAPVVGPVVPKRRAWSTGTRFTSIR